MVYESDFYTSRRPYSRPTVSSYSVTTDPLMPISGLGQGPYHHTIPYIGHKRLTQVTTPARIHVRPSVIMGELDRIQHRSRPHITFRPTDNYLNSRSAVTFDDETRSIRAQTQALLRRINSPVPRTHKPLPISTTRYEFDYEEPFVTSRITSDAYIERLLGPVRRVQRDVESMSRYPEPGNNRRLIGKGHLACISFAGGRAFSRRKGLTTFDDRISDDVTYLSHYKKNRNAANGVKEEGQAWNNMNSLIHGPSLVRSRFYKPSYSNEKVTLAKEASPPAWDRKAKFVDPSTRANIKAERQTSRKDEAAAAAEEVEDTGARMNRRKKEKQEEARLAEELASAEANEKAEEQARKAELARQEEMAQQAAQERQEELDRKAALAQEEEEIARQIEAEKKSEKERKSEAKKKAAAEKQAEAERKAEEERIAAEQQAEAARVAEEERKAEEDKKAEEARIAAEKQAEEEKKAEENRLAEEARKAEAERLEAEAAAAAEAEAAASAAAAAEVTEVVEEPVIAEDAPVEEAAVDAVAVEEVAVEEVAVEEVAVEEVAVEEVTAPAEESAPVEAEEPVAETVEAPIEEAAPVESETVPEEPTIEVEEPAEPVIEEPQSPEVQTEASPACEEVESIANAVEEAE